VSTPATASNPSPTLSADHPYPLRVMQELRTDHAGETGAVMIYRGVLAFARDPELRAFALHHLETEARHLSLIEQVASASWRSRLLPLWRLSGWLTGALPALVGPRAVYATIQSVETFVDHHYADQVSMIDAFLAGQSLDASSRERLVALRALLEECRLDEVAHRDDAASRFQGRAGMCLRLWQRVVGSGSQAAVKVCRHV
jgi:ubiquinone biosynthesis monooxygenase Coq7